MQKIVEEFLNSKPGYIKKGKYEIAKILSIEPNKKNIELIVNSIKKVKSNILNSMTNKEEIREKDSISILLSKNEQLALDAINYYLSKKEYKAADIILKSITPKEKKSRVLVIGDIHEPFTKVGYLEFCKEQYKIFNCDKVVFIGDIVDNCYSSFHPSDPDGYGAGDELDRAIDKIALWHDAFPNATVILGNHDRLAYRKAFSGGISKRWLRSYGDVLNTPTWTFKEEETIDNVLYIHGEGGTARMKAKSISQSVVQGHLHPQAYVEFINNRIFGVQVGCGIDDSLYAFNYNKAGKESIISCAVIEEGKNAIIIKQ